MCLETDFRARSERRVTEALEDKECVQVKAKATVVRADFARVYTIMMLACKPRRSTLHCRPQS